MRIPPHTGALAWTIATCVQAQSVHLVEHDEKTVQELMLECTRSESALLELQERLTSGRLSEAEEADLIELALEVQRSTERPWDASWGDVIEQARARGICDDVQWMQYARQAFLMKLLVRRTIRQGAPIPREIRIERRFGNSSKLQWRAEWKGDFLDDVPLESGMRSSELTGVGTESELPETVEIQFLPRNQRQVGDDSTSSLEPGLHRVRSDWHLSVSDREGVWVDSILAVDEDVEIVTSDVETVELVTEGAMEERLEGAVRCRASHRHSAAKGSVAFVDAPVDCAFDIYWRIGSDEWYVGSASCKASTRTPSFQYFRFLRGFDGDQIAIVLRPNSDVAERTIEITRIWGSELVIENVRVQR